MFKRLRTFNLTLFVKKNTMFMLNIAIGVVLSGRVCTWYQKCHIFLIYQFFLAFINLTIRYVILSGFEKKGLFNGLSKSSLVSSNEQATF